MTGSTDAENGGDEVERALAAWIDLVRCYGYDPDVVLRLTHAFLEKLTVNPALAGALMLSAKQIDPWEMP